MIHRGLTCMECGMSPIRGTQYSCLECLSYYYICGSCKEKGTHGHHKMEEIKGEIGKL